VVVAQLPNGSGLMSETDVDGAGDEDHVTIDYAVAILDATVRSLSSLVLFRSKACCRQSSRFEQLWCSGRRCEPQNWERQWGHSPTMRKAAEVQWESVPTPDWQRFLAGMVERKARVSRRG